MHLKSYFVPFHTLHAPRIPFCVVCPFVLLVAPCFFFIFFILVDLPPPTRSFVDLSLPDLCVPFLMHIALAKGQGADGIAQEIKYRLYSVPVAD